MPSRAAQVFSMFFAATVAFAGTLAVLSMPFVQTFTDLETAYPVTAPFLLCALIVICFVSSKRHLTMALLGMIGTINGILIMLTPGFKKVLPHIMENGNVLSIGSIFGLTLIMLVFSSMALAKIFTKNTPAK